MARVSSACPEYDVNPAGFLADPGQWTSDFAEQSASGCGIINGLTERHWQVINFIRLSYELEGKCPLIYQTCRSLDLTLAELKHLFPSGYLRGACKLAGLGWKETCPDSPTVDYADWNGKATGQTAELGERSRALSATQRKIIAYLQEYYRQNGNIPTVYQTCEVFRLEIEDLERLFPEGYHQGAVRAAGLQYSDH